MERDFYFMEYYLYILYSKSGDRFYKGSSDNPHRRLTYHNTIEKGFTSRYRPWELVFIKKYPDKRTAREAEQKVKKWKSRLMIEKLIRGEITI